MQTLNKTEQIAHLQGKRGVERELAVQDTLVAYRDTPHPATGVTPYENMHGRPIRTRQLDHEGVRETDQRGTGQRIQETNGATEKKRKETKLLIEGLRTAETEED